MDPPRAALEARDFERKHFRRERNFFLQSCLARAERGR
jgi:hypothetical protein